MSIFSIKRTSILVMAMSFLNTLFGGNSAAVSGPDFDDATNKVIHIRSIVTVEYRMPGNMSNMLNYGARYANEVPTTIAVDIDSPHEYVRTQWRSSVNLDGGVWDYSSKGTAGLDLNIELVPLSGTLSVQDDVRSRYEEYLNGPEGLNTGVRSRSPHSSDFDLRDDLRPVPSEFETTKVDGYSVLSWIEGVERQGVGTRYHAIDLGGCGHYLLFAFHYNLSAKTDKEAQDLRNRLAEDIESFMSNVSLKSLR